ncbi:MAG: ATP-binding protein [Candidatus Hodarchaeales archaeon]|jgi:hypothetical protein
MEPTISVLLDIAARAIISTLAGKIPDALYHKLKGDPAKKAYKQALAATVGRYATGERLALSRPLLDKKGILIDKQVAAELALLLRFGDKPNLELIGKKWEAAVTNPPRFHNFTEEAGLLVGYLDEELRNSEVFRPVFKAQDLNAISINTKSIRTIEESLTAIEMFLEGLVGLLDAGLAKLLAQFASSSSSIRDQIRDFTRYIEEKTRGFVGRQWVFKKVEHFMDDNPRGYYFIIGDPGIGKSALAAQMVRQNGYLHHFNILANGICRPLQFLKNVCAQLISTYELDYTSLPPEAAEDSGFLEKLLEEVSNKLGAREQCVIIVDALDEAVRAGMPQGANLLYLPRSLPDGVYIVVTMRDDKDIRPHVQCEHDELPIEADSSDNLTDIKDFLRAATVNPGIQEYIKNQKMKKQEFVAMMVQKSEGNFMYLHHVLPEICQGAYKDRKLENIPTGLENYYEDHWRRMRTRDETLWFEYKLPVIVALTAVHKPVSIDLINSFSGVPRKRIRYVLQEWAQFLHAEQVEYEGGAQIRYSLYHSSFHKFICRKEEVEDERVNLKDALAKIVKKEWSEYIAMN